MKEHLWRWADRAFEFVGPVVGFVLLVFVVAPMIIWLRIWYRLTGRDPNDVLGTPNWLM